MTKIKSLHWIHRLIIVPTSWDFVCVHGMSCALEVNSNGGLKREDVESCSPTTKNIISPLPHRQWLQNLAGWWLTMWNSHQWNHMILWLRGLLRSLVKLNHHNSTTRVAIAAKLSRMVVHLDGLLTIKPHDHVTN